jgi:hypothetical protein
VLYLVDRNDLVCEIVASKIIEIGTNGIHDPREIAEAAVDRLEQRSAIGSDFSSRYDALVQTGG